MATKYNTLSLEGGENRKKKSVATYVAAGLLILAVAGIGSTLVGHQANSAANAEYQNFRADVVDCWGSIPTAEDPDALKAKVLAQLPQDDPAYTSKANGNAEFYNACYYAYSCCTETRTDCLVSTGYGAACKSCIKNNGPKMVLPVCENYANSLSGNDKKRFVDQSITQDKGFPANNEIVGDAFRMQFNLKKNAGHKSCWYRAGPADDRMKTFHKDCWEAISWCNLLCPRDDQNQVQSDMCKECIDMGFETRKANRIHSMAK